MKVIVAYWVKPFEYTQGFDSRPKSIERVCTTTTDLRRYLISVHGNQDGTSAMIQWSDSIVGLCNPRFKGSNTKVYDNDGFGYLQRCLDNDRLGICFAHIIGRQGEYYYGFQVRNLH